MAWVLRPGPRGTTAQVRGAFAQAARGPADDSWDPPGWLLPHQVDAACRLAGSLAAFGGALCADAVGLGKTYVALAIATRHRRVAVIVPAILLDQWRRRAALAGITLSLVSHESLSRGAPVPRADLVIVDEAHRFRNPDTRRYRALAHRPPGLLLLLTATPVVNRSADLVALLRLFLSDNGLAFLGVPSLEEAQTGRDLGAIALAASAVTVARSPMVVTTAGLPVARDATIVTPPFVSTPALEWLLAGIAGLRYPTFADRTAARLLDLHLRYRFASSLAAGRETLRHHLHYLERALRAARRGRRLARSAAAGLLQEERDGQLELEIWDTGEEPVDASEVEAEYRRIRDLIAGLATLPETGPKLEHLRALLTARTGHKTIVFTAAVATARSIAKALGWYRVAVVSGKGAWIASGKVPVSEALGLFAPRARGVPPPGPAQGVTTLIATDLASEGLDLQDADAVVHYDLPWTPLRLDQRLGRVARLGSTHNQVEVFWFAPPYELDRGLALRRRIASKLDTQFALGVPESSSVGRARVTGRALEWRERLAALHSAHEGPRFAVVAGPRAAVFALTWHRGGYRVPEVLAVVGKPGCPVREPGRVGALLEQLLVGPAASGQIDFSPWLALLRRIVRERFNQSELGAQDAETRRIARLIVRRGTRAATTRDEDVLSALDRALSRLLAGVTTGGVDLLCKALDGRDLRHALEAWSVSQPGPPGPIQVTLEGAIFGDGTSDTLSSRPAE